LRHDQLDDALGELGEQFRLAAIREAEVQARVRQITRRARRRRGALAIVAVLVPTAAVAGVGGIFPSGDPLPGAEHVPRVQAGVIPSSATPDPAGLLPWALQLQSRPDGRDCLLLGRLRAGDLGQIENGRFRAYPADAPGLCGDLQRDPILAFVDVRTRPHPRTIIFGLAPDRAPVTLRIRGRQLSQVPHALGAYLFVLSGRQPTNGAVISTRSRGKAISIRLG
jgi:hypothetical protein